MKRIGVLSFSVSLSMFGLLAAPPASLAHADENGDSWGAIWYRSSTDHEPVRDFQSKVAALRYIQDNYGNDTRHVVYPSGWCGALISYTDLSGKERLASGTGEGSRDAALKDVLYSTKLERNGQYEMLEAECQE